MNFNQMETTSLQHLSQLEDQLLTLVEKLKSLRQANMQLQQTLNETTAKLEKKHESSREWQEKYEALKSAQGINSGDAAAKKRAMHHIDALISEVDACIAQLEIED